MNLIRNIFKSIFSKNKVEAKFEPKTESFKINTPKPKEVRVERGKRRGDKHPLHHAHFGTFSPCKSL